jgi:bifunctional ADP-heptose synthase (sugar kinase/adenylyltransferase)
MDTRSKIVNAAAAPRGCTVVTGGFDVLLAADARELAEIRARDAEKALVAVVLPVAGELLPEGARAQLVAAIRMVDYVVIAGETAPDVLLAALEPARVVRLEAAQAERKRQLMEHVQHGPIR